MADSIWHALCNQPTQPVSTEKYATIVDDSTTQLHEPIHSILSTLDRRAMALTKLANFESALHDAKAMQQLSPSLALGYVREADIYSEQGKQQQAIDVCIKGLDLVDTNDHGYASLQRAKMDAEQRQNKCIDFIGQLPMDIVITTLIPMFMYLQRWESLKPTPSMHVSHEWRNRIIQSFNGLRIRLHELDDVSGYIPLARHITTLVISSFTEGTWLCDLFRNNDLCSLKDLTIGIFSADCVDYLVSSLKSVRNTLTHLEIVHGGDTTLPIGDILDNCPNLVYLDIPQPHDMGITSLPMTTWSKLTTLMISNAREMITRDEVNAIGKRFPSLTKLQLYPWQDPESTRMVFDCYPWMNSIDIVKISSAFNIAYYQHKPRRTGNGVTNIDIRVYSMKDDDWKYLIHILREHSLTLEWMYVYVVVVNVHEEVHNIKYPCLKHLILDHSGWWIPRNAPMLEDLEIQQLSYCLEVRVVPDTASPKLKRLQVHRDCPTHTGDTPPLERYLHQLAQHAQLQDLDVTLYSLERIDHILDAMLHLGSLVRLMMFVTSDWGSTSMHRFLAGLSKGCPKLSSLGISCHNAPSACSMNALKQLLHLERFGFSIEGMDSDDAFWHAIETFPQLKSIYIFPSNETNIRRLRYLKEKRPDLKITISRRLNDI